jgi:hypothetical protein
MLMNIFQRLSKNLNQPDLDEVLAFQYKIPNSITVDIVKEGDQFIARVEKINGEELKKDTFITEAETINELVVEVNDMLLTYLDFPENIKPRMPQLLPPESELKRLIGTKSRELVFAK